MGWTSCFENICLRQAESEQSGHAFVSAAGTPPSFSGGTVPDLASALSAAYSRLKPLCLQIRPEVVKGYQALSARMDHVGEKVKLFKSTRFAGEGRLYDEETALTEEIEEIEAVRGRAEMVLHDLSPSARYISVELERIERLLEIAGQSVIPGRDRDLEQQAIWFLHGYKALIEQIEEIGQRPDDLKVELGGDVFDRLMANPSMDVQDKDIYPEEDE